MLAGIDKGLSRIESVTDYFAAAAMFLTMVIVGGEVISRYFLNAPLPWSYDVLTLYILPALFFLGLPGSYSKHAHIAVDLLIGRLPLFVVAIFVLIGRLAGLILFACIAYYGAEHTIEAFKSDESVPGVIQFAVWPSFVLVPVGCTLMLLRMLSELPADCMAIARGGKPDPDAVQVEKELSFYE